MKIIYATILLSLSVSVHAGENWKYIKPDRGFHNGYAITESGSAYIRYEKEGFSYVSNVPCVHIDSFSLNGIAIETKCIQNKHGNWQLQFPNHTNETLISEFTKKSKVKISVLYSDNSNSNVVFSAMGFSKSRNAVLSN